MKLADLVDLEWLLADGKHLTDDVVTAARPAAVTAAGGRRGAVDGDVRIRERVCLALLDAARQAQPELPGRTIERALATAGVLLTAAGLLLGAGTALGVLAYDGRTPVNVLHFVLVFCLLQIVLLALLVWFLLRSGRTTWPSLVQRAVAWLVDRALGRRGRQAAELLRVLRARNSLYSGVEKWTMFTLVQRLGVAFNVAALVTMLLLVTGTDLVFSWSTTLGLDMHGLTTALSAPWSFWPPGVPSAETVAATQWVRMPGKFVSGDSLANVQPLAAEWTRFLAAGLVAYGLLPRLLAAGFGAFRRARSLRAAPLDHAGFHALYDRLLPRDAGFVGPDPAAVRGAPPAAGRALPATAHAPKEPGAPAVVFCWGSVARASDVVRAAVESRFGVRVLATPAAGGRSLDADGKALQQLHEHRAQRAVLVFAAGQQPTADALAFVRGVRKQLGSSRPLIVLLASIGANGSLADAEPDEHAIWRRSLGGLDDPYLWLETLAGQR